MKENDGWVKDLFIEKGELFLKVLNYMWERAERDVDSIEKLFNKYDINKDANILEIGCGNGRILINLAIRGYTNLYGLDISPLFIEDAKKKMEECEVRNIKFFAGDVKKIDKIFEEKKFDVILNMWTTILGYYSEKEDKKIFKKYAKVSNDNGYLFILNTVNRDYVINVRSLGCQGPFYNEYKNFVIIDEVEYDPITSITISKWKFYEKLENNDLKYLDEAKIRLRIYSLHEVVKMCEEAGWEYVDAYRNLRTLDDFALTLSSLNLIFRKTK